MGFDPLTKPKAQVKAQASRPKLQSKLGFLLFTPQAQLMSTPNSAGLLFQAQLVLGPRKIQGPIAKDTRHIQMYRNSWALHLRQKGSAVFTST